MTATELPQADIGEAEFLGEHLDGRRQDTFVELLAGEGGHGAEYTPDILGQGGSRASNCLARESCRRNDLASAHQSPRSRTMEQFELFVSYSRSDERLVKPVVQLMAIGGRPVYWDAQIQPGERWSDAIVDAIRRSSTLVVLWCCHAAQSEWVAKETELALAADKPLVPVLLCSYPVRTPLDQYQWIDQREFVRHHCYAHGTAREPARGTNGAELLRRGVGLQSFDPDDVAETWARAQDAEARRMDTVALSQMIGGAALVVLGASGATDQPHAARALRFVLGVVGAALTLTGARHLTRWRGLAGVPYESQLLGLTVLSIIRLQETGELSEFVTPASRTAARGTEATGGIA